MKTFFRSNNFRHAMHTVNHMTEYMMALIHVLRLRTIFR